MPFPCLPSQFLLLFRPTVIRVTYKGNRLGSHQSTRLGRVSSQNGRYPSSEQCIGQSCYPTNSSCACTGAHWRWNKLSTRIMEKAPKGAFQQFLNGFPAPPNGTSLSRKQANVKLQVQRRCTVLVRKNKEVHKSKDTCKKNALEIIITILRRGHDMPVCKKLL